MRFTCPKCGEISHYGGSWHPDLGSPICSHCLGLDDMAEAASYREDDEEGDDDDC